MKNKDKVAADVLDLLVETSYDDVQIAYEVGASVPQVKNIIRKAMQHYQVKTRELLIQCLEQDVF